MSLREFLRELVGVVASTDIAGSILVEIFNCGENGDVEKVAQTSKQFFCVCDYLSLSLFTRLYLYILHAHIVRISICLILIMLN